MSPDYIIIISILFIILFIACLLLGLSYILNSQENNFVKLSSYECGFQPFEDSRSFFNIEFYLVGILFVIFDLEIVFLFPLCVCSMELPLFGLLVAFAFLAVLTLGFVYEWIKGALDW